jgi:hypothetical protein
VSHPSFLMSISRRSFFAKVAGAVVATRVAPSLTAQVWGTTGEAHIGAIAGWFTMTIPKAGGGWLPVRALVDPSRPASERFIEMTRPSDANKWYLPRHECEPDPVTLRCGCGAHPRAAVHRLPGKRLTDIVRRQGL